MYDFPYGAGQQLNLNWIINEIITLHKQLDPDWDLPQFDTAFPYTNLNTLNLDWILRELKAIKDLAPTEDAQLLKMVANALIANTYDAETQYNVDDIVYRDSEKRLYKCITATPAGGEVWNAAHWQEIKVGEVLTYLLLITGAITSNDVSNESGVTGTTVTDAINNLFSAINNKLDNNPARIELMPPTTATNGGFIDFHYAGDASDYTARIIEQPQGHIKVYGTVDLQTPLPVTSGGTGYNTVDTTPTENSDKLITSGGVFEALKLYSTLATIDTSFGSTISVTARRTGLVAQLNSAVLQNSPIQYTNAGWKTICTLPLEFQITQQMRFALINYSTGEIYQARVTEKMFPTPNVVQVYIDTPNINKNFLPSFTFLYLLD